MDQSQAIEVKDYCCPECNGSGIEVFGKEKPKLVGWADTEWGFQMIVECPCCFTKYRFHGSSGWDDQRDLDRFETALRCYLLGNYFSNAKEIKSKVWEK